MNKILIIILILIKFGVLFSFSLKEDSHHHHHYHCCQKPSIISSGFCKRFDYYFIILGSERISPCPNDSTTIDWNFSKVINGTFIWYQCINYNNNSETNLTYYQVGGCINPRNIQLFEIKKDELFSFINCIKDGNILISSEFKTNSPNNIYKYISSSILPHCKNYQTIIYRIWVPNGDTIKCLNNSNNSTLTSTSTLCACPSNYSVILGDGVCNSTTVSQIILPVKHSSHNNNNNNNFNTKEEEDNLKKNKAIFSIFISLLVINYANANVNNEDEVDYLKCDPKYCLKLECGPKQTPCKKANSCCKGCKPDCSIMRCAKVCTDDEIPVIDDCSCCPSDCTKNCSAIECPLIKCAPGYISIKKGCCNECVRDCKGIACGWPKCNDGQIPITKEDDCCPSCPAPIDCRLVLCTKPDCKDGKSPVKLPGQCCEQCL